MTTHSDADILRIYDRWHETVVARDLDGLMSLYADHAVLETPLIVVTLPALGTGLFLSNGRRLTWEYPRETPDGDQVDLVEVMDIDRGLIVHHRVYWGWVGFRSLMAAAVTTDS
ncbi:nuclear transport factor 2 family protein [Burkholderia sp. F1]|uniref:nuclear transport factor 2 family protein n=1 Tax=Burkholderia sp. F1 TaxID=3366817 RepID=UPI003D72537B